MYPQQPIQFVKINLDSHYLNLSLDVIKHLNNKINYFIHIFRNNQKIYNIYIEIGIKHIKRGVKEVGKALRKKTLGQIININNINFHRIVVFAADISPVDVLSHLPLQCEELGIPYCYVRSRLELGAAAQTKKPTSVVLIQVPTKEDIKGLERYHQLFDKVKEINPFI